jgi:hypothetical protein
MPAWATDAQPKRALRRRTRLAARTGFIGAMLASPCAAADPQVSVGLTVGGAVENAIGAEGTRGAFHLGGRASALFLRNHGDEMALGPYVDAATAGFQNTDLGGGLEWLLPARDDLPIVLSAGAFARDARSRPWTAGGEGTVFFGSRSYNFHSWYGLAAGIFAQARWIPSPPASVDFVFGAQIDTELLALPFVFLYEAFR